jgi:hypothetical protein
MLRSTQQFCWLRSALALLVFSIVTLGAVAPASAYQAENPEPLDLGAMVLNAADLAGLDLDGFRVRGSQAIDSFELATRYAAQLGGDPEKLETAFDETSIVWSYDAALDLVPEPDDPASVTTDRVFSFITEHVDADGAATDLTLRTGGTDSDDAIADAPTIGDESILTRFTGRTNDESQLYVTGLDFTFRVDRVVAGVQLLAFDDRADEVDEPAQKIAEALADRLLERIELGMDGETPGLSTQVIRIQLPGGGAGGTLDMYELLDGSIFPYIGKSDASLNELTEQVEDYEIMTRYRVEQPLSSETGAVNDPEGPYLVLRVSQFGDDLQAAGWVSDAADRMEADPDMISVEIVDDTNTLGDAFLGVAYEIDYGDVTVSGHAVYLQFGEIAFSVEVDNAELDSVIALATAQLECLEDGECLAPIPIPETSATSSLAFGNAA